MVDDSPVVRERLQNMLSEIPGVEVVGEAENAEQARLKIPLENPEVVILDISMPGESGIDLLRFLKTMEIVPVVMMLTNYPYPQYREESLEAGADFFFDKSSEFLQLIDVVRDLNQQVHIPLSF